MHQLNENLVDGIALIFNTENQNFAIFQELLDDLGRSDNDGEIKMIFTRCLYGFMPN